MFKIIVSLVLASMLSACAGVDFGSPNTYQRYDVQHSGTVEEGTVLRTRSITIEASQDNSGLTSLISAGVGAFLGSRTIGNGTGRYIAGALSGAASGFVTQKVSQALSHHAGLEIIVRTSTGRNIVVAQPDDQQFAPGDHVLLISTNSGLRVTH
ncbi:Outer membrane lipoprotein pcp [Paraburkholderia nemoris]|uniref:glycine zipper 2TM domain-containing protein n=1 Tax=Paraburkholderia nemoris TaxID=2793076 RepID=UPI001909951D|nr:MULTISPECIES: glycine zipper 2TM domain-containing protein [Paraburkholderia]MBK3786889.1 glycine zipper 2TM domain-containing protein [Paraburkholderia aspalathi]CAE6864294.1 Outer membrane lipoprotein pcp [Paraburkholderia nemoris]